MICDGHLGIQRVRSPYTGLEINYSTFQYTDALPYSRVFMLGFTSKPRKFKKTLHFLRINTLSSGNESRMIIFTDQVNYSLLINQCLLSCELNTSAFVGILSKSFKTSKTSSKHKNFLKMEVSHQNLFKKNGWDNFSIFYS